MQLYTFRATAGSYTLSLAAGTCIGALETQVAKLLPGKRVDPKQDFVQVRKSVPFYCLPVGILLTIISGGCIVGGLVAGLLAHQLFNG